MLQNESELLIPFIETLPVMAKYFLSAGAASSDLLCKLLLKMRPEGAKYISSSPWAGKCLFNDGSLDEGKAQALTHVLHHLCAENGIMYRWNGSMHLRLSAILHLYNFLHQNECHELVSKAMFRCYPLLLTSQSGSEEEAVDQAFLNDSEKYFLSLFRRSPSNFRSFCSSFASTHINNLPDAAIQCIEWHLRSSWKDFRYKLPAVKILDTITAGLDDLFRHFLKRKLDLNSTVRQVEEGQYPTLLRLLDIVITFRYSLLGFGRHDIDHCLWKLLDSWLDITEQQLARFSPMQRDPVLAGHGEEEENSAADDIEHPSVHTAHSEDRPMHADHLRDLVDRIKRALDRYPLELPLPLSPVNSSSSRSTIE
jgi:hypothetical protein